ncbi:MAG: serine/threonine-protein kinase [Sandaracinaceae bacterium]
MGSLIAGKYRLERLLGTGAIGAVYAAVHQFTRKNVAIKLIDASFAEYEGYGVRFLREARAAAEIDHPVICDVVDAGAEPDGTLYLALELLEGSTLEHAIDQNDLRLDEIVEVSIQLLDGMAAAHDRGIVHRDIKPDNVFLTRDEHGNLRVKIIDFGVAKHSRSGPEVFTTAQGAVLGTPWYMAPEQAAGDPVDPRADLWSVGAVMFHALTGQPPFPEESYNRLIARLLNESPPRLATLRPQLPVWLSTTVDGALQRDPSRRWSTARAMCENLRSQGNASIDLDWESHEDATLRTDSLFSSDDEGRPATLQLLSGATEQKVELDISLEEELLQYGSLEPTASGPVDAGGGLTIKSVPPPHMPPPPPKGRPRTGLWLGVALGLVMGGVIAVALALAYVLILR